MLSADLPEYWHAEAWSTQETTVLWRLTPTQQPRLEHLECQVFQLSNQLSWCEKGTSLWLLQKLDDVYWLSEFRKARRTSLDEQQDWRGTKLQQFSAQGESLTIYDNPHHPKQLENYIHLRHRGRNPQFTELSHGRFYLSLQNPREDIFVYARTQGLLLVSAQQPD